MSAFDAASAILPLALDTLFAIIFNIAISLSLPLLFSF
jgi:hypothetical protein